MAPATISITPKSYCIALKDLISLMLLGCVIVLSNLCNAEFLSPPEWTNESYYESAGFSFVDGGNITLAWNDSGWSVINLAMLNNCYDLVDGINFQLLQCKMHPSDISSSVVTCNSTTVG